MTPSYELWIVNFRNIVEKNGIFWVLIKQMLFEFLLPRKDMHCTIFLYLQLY